MARRIRSIKPEVLEDEKMANLSDAAWRLFVASWVLADDEGRFRAGGRYLAAQVWHDTSKVDAAEAARSELVQRGRIVVYEVGDETYAEIPTWNRHQRIDNGSKSRLPRRGSANLRPVSPIPAAGYGYGKEVDRDIGESANSELAQAELGLGSSTVDSGDTEQSDKFEKRQRRKEPEREIPTGWAPAEAHYEYAKTKRGFDRKRVDLEAEKFKNHAESRGRKAARWNAAFNNWILAANDAAHGFGGQSSRQPQRAPPPETTISEAEYLAKLDAQAALTTEDTF